MFSASDARRLSGLASRIRSFCRLRSSSAACTAKVVPTKPGLRMLTSLTINSLLSVKKILAADNF